MSPPFSQLLIFYYVIDYMSFSKAATHLKCSKAHISKQIKDLERFIGTPLIQRNTRTLALTFAGETMFKHSQAMVEEYRAAEQSIANLQTKASGLLRITAPNAYADYILSPHLSTFLKEYPEISIEMNLTGSLLNLIEEKIDVAIRLTHEPPLDRIAKQVGHYQMIICASESYLCQSNPLDKPQQLAEHHALVYSTERYSRQWPFHIDKKLHRIPIKPIISANSNLILLNAALNGIGVARLPDYVVNSSLKNHQLKALLKDYYPEPIPIYAVYSQSRIIPPKIQAFVRFLETIHRSWY